MAQILAREAALRIAEHEVGVREQGANNRGKQVEIYQTADGLPGGGYAWCNSFVDWCFEMAGRPLDELARSAGVDLTFHLAANHGWTKNSPGEADLVIFSFSHIGFVKKVVSKSEIETIEGNTGSSGSVSDSHGGGDGVYDKTRATYLVRPGGYVEVPGKVDDKKFKAYIGGDGGHPKLVLPTSDEDFWAWLRWDQGRAEFAKFGAHNLKHRPAHVPTRIPAAWWKARATWLSHQPKSV